MQETAMQERKRKMRVRQIREEFIKTPSEFPETLTFLVGVLIKLQPPDETAMHETTLNPKPQTLHPNPKI